MPFGSEKVSERRFCISNKRGLTWDTTVHATVVGFISEVGKQSALQYWKHSFVFAGKQLVQPF